MNLASRKSAMLRYFTVAAMLAFVGCTTTLMKYTPQQMSDMVINRVNADPKTDPNPRTLTFDQTACANKARFEYPIVAVNEGGIIANSMLSGAAGGAGSGAAAAAGTGHAGQAAAINSVGGAAQGGQNGLQEIQNAYLMQAYQQGIHYGLCLVQHGHSSHLTEADLERARSDDPALARSDVGSPQVGPAPASPASPKLLQMARSTLLGVWRGSYQCAQGETGVELSFTDISADGVVMGTFTFFNLPGQSNVDDGEYSLIGRVNSAERQLYFNPGTWIRQPPGYIPVGFSAPLPLPGTQNISGTITNPGCSQIYAVKAGN